jgi:hypothetical protein
MTKTLAPFVATRTARDLLTWLGVTAATLLAAATAMPVFAAGPHGTNAANNAAKGAAMLRPGNWAQDSGSYLLPAGLNKPVKDWPASSWYRVTQKAGALEVQAVATPATGLPDFLSEIAMQVVDPEARVYARPEAQAEAIDTRYIRLPGVKLAEGRLPLVQFSNGVLRPRLDHTYALSLGDTTFTLTVQDGLRNKAGVAYGQGAQYTVATMGESYVYQLGAYGNSNGQDTVVQAVADLDGDGKPDFIVLTDGGTHEFLLLSSQAKPGRNAPAAVLSQDADGC